ncbi:hypothetical protein DM01DRAFT_323044 [Hesseltinella vesiculosa]|uniref:Uncharacterized protein n=1 Tax=Hesseltinella vesiculosa TaxID=101127 RepID=A0A1X2GT28_9FUNG|nr:hypothetical protein DM01DRAFT_323044 [Hesseltinella vesiculosa]
MNDLQTVTLDPSDEKPKALTSVHHPHTPQENITAWRFRIVLIAFLIIMCVTVTIVINEYLK